MEKQERLDSRIKTLIENCVKSRQRSFFVLVGSKSREMVHRLHFLYLKFRQHEDPKILWCYSKKNHGFDQNKGQKVKTKKGQKDSGEVLDDLQVILSAMRIDHRLFKDTQTILGSTYQMLVLQEFEGLSPNVLARTIETVEGGGLVILLLPSMNSLTEMFTMKMDFHSQFQTPYKLKKVINRFNERFLLSLLKCENCLFLSDTLKVLPSSEEVLNTIKKTPGVLSISNNQDRSPQILGRLRLESEETEKKLKNLENTILYEFLKVCRTFDQANILLKFFEVLSSNTLEETVALTSARGRGKSALLGLVISIAIHLGFSNIFVTSPSPENLQTLFQFVVMGLDKILKYKELEDYKIFRATHPSLRKAIVRIQITKKKYRQMIQYILPADYQKLHQCELLVIDEAAAIPLPIVKTMLGPFLVFISSTVNGYEGTGRSLSLKLFKELKERSSSFAAAKQQRKFLSSKKVMSSSSLQKTMSSDEFQNQYYNQGRKFLEFELSEPIRYSLGDKVEKWLMEFLCLENNVDKKSEIKTCPHPDSCDLYYVNKETLFSYHSETEYFLHKLILLFTSSHYRNSPNDLQLLSDSPDHHIFVLLGPIDENPKQLPDIFAAIQVCIEGAISKNITKSFLNSGKQGHGDMVPWLISRFFQETEFGEFRGLRIVRIATHSNFQRMGYGNRAMRLLTNFYQGKLRNLVTSKPQKEEEEDGEDEDIYDNEEEEKEKEEEEEEEEEEKNIDINDQKIGNIIAPPPPQSSSLKLFTEILKCRPKSTLLPLLESLDDRIPKKIDYFSVCYGLTESLHNFWTKIGFASVYVRLTCNEMTGEHTCLMLKDINLKNNITQEFHVDFRKRFISLLGFKEFRDSFSTSLVLSVIGFRNEDVEVKDCVSCDELNTQFSKFDVKRMNVYSQNLLDYRIIIDLVPIIAKLYFLGKIPIRINTIDEVILAGIGFQRKSFTNVADEVKLSIHQIVALFHQVMKKCVKMFNKVYQKKIEEDGFKDKDNKIDEGIGIAKKRKRDDFETSKNDDDEEERPKKKSKR